MTDQLTALETQLSGLTAWPAGAALPSPSSSADHSTPRGRVAQLLTVQAPRHALALALAAFTLVVFVFVALPSVSSPRRGAVVSEAAPTSAPAILRTPFSVTSFGDPGDPMAHRPAAPSMTHFGRIESPQQSATEDPALPAPTAPTPRLIVRKASIDLVSPDIHATLQKAAMLISEAGGEYVEHSSVSGDDDSASASVKLRVRAERLEQVLAALRALGEVRAETVGGEDVTTQFIDLEARLRNEQRIETELLHLLDSRPDAPLKDVLDVRESLGRVRLEIERLTASREQLSRLISLATVLVTIRADAPQAPARGLAAYLGDQVSDAWHEGLRAMANSVAWALQTLLSGLLLWIPLALLLLGAFLVYRRARRRRADEPAPALS